MHIGMTSADGLLLACRCLGEVVVVVADDDDAAAQQAVVLVVGGVDPRFEPYRHHDRDGLLHVLVKRDEAVEDLKARLRNLQQKNRRLGSRADRLEQRMVEIKQNGDADAGVGSLVVHHTPNKKMSVQSLLALGLRRNLGNAAATDLGPLILSDVSKQMVLRSEIITAASLCSYAREWHAAHEMGLRHP